MHVYGRFPGQEMKIDSEHGLCSYYENKERKNRARARRTCGDTEVSNDLKLVPPFMLFCSSVAKLPWSYLALRHK